MLQVSFSEVKIQLYLPLLMSSDKLEADNWENDYLDRYFVNIFQINNEGKCAQYMMHYALC